MMSVLLVGGGTLGSVTPLLAVAEDLSREFQIAHFTFHIAFWGTRTGPERVLVEAAGIPFRSIPTGKLRRYWDVRNLLDLIVVKWAFGIAFVRLIRWRPSVVVGAGSFVQVPVMWAAWVLRIPILIHQQDVQPGLANRLIAPFASTITAAFPTSARSFGRHRVTVVGNPVRQAILATRGINPGAAKRHFGFGGDRPVLLILGGGTGAQALNELVAAALVELTAHADILHVTGPKKGIGMEHQASSISKRYRSFELLTDDLPFAYAAADLVVARAGLGTITELGVLGKAMALIPMPDSHQGANAAFFAERGAAIVWSERDLTSEEFSRRVLALLYDRPHCDAIAGSAPQLFPTDAAARLAAEIRHLV